MGSHQPSRRSLPDRLCRRVCAGDKQKRCIALGLMHPMLATVTLGMRQPPPARCHVAVRVQYLAQIDTPSAPCRRIGCLCFSSCVNCHTVKWRLDMIEISKCFLVCLCLLMLTSCSSPPSATIEKHCVRLDIARGAIIENVGERPGTERRSRERAAQSCKCMMSTIQSELSDEQLTSLAKTLAKANSVKDVRRNTEEGKWGVVDAWGVLFSSGLTCFDS